MKKIIVFLMLFLISFPVYAATEAPVDVLNMNIEEIQSAVDKGYIDYETLTKIYLERIEKYNDNYNAILSVNENALSEAKKLDEEYKKTGKRSLLMGIPIVVKDNIDVEGLPTTAGSKALSDSYPNSNSEVVQKLIDAGAIIIGKTNMSEFAFEASNSRSSYGHTYNAYNLEYTPYGSSGGTAVAVAANLAVAGLGTDTNSSVRAPSSANNVVGLRPTYGLISSDGVITYDSARDTVGPITKYVEDNAIMLSIINDENNSYEISKSSSDLKKIKVGVLTNFMDEDGTSTYLEPLTSTYSEIVSLMNDSIDALKDIGVSIVNIDDFYNDTYNNIVTTSYSGILLCYDFNNYIQNTTSKIKSFSDLLQNGGYIQSLSGYNSYCNTDYKTTTNYSNILKKKSQYKEYVLSVMEEYDVDVLIYPTTKNKLLKINELGTTSMKVNSYIIAPTIGFPSLNVSIGFDSDNLPYGMEILSKPNEENLLYNLAYYYQEKTNYYKLPDIAPSLYEMPEGIELLISNYEKLTSKKYSSVKKEAYEFFTNYNDVENKEETITKLNNEYSKLKKQIIPTSINVDESLINKLIKFGTKLLLSFILLFTIIFVILKKVERKNKSLKFNIKKFFKLLFKMIIIYIFIFIIYFLYIYFF